MATGLKLNIGCGPTDHFAGFVNIDNSPAVILSRIPPLKRILFWLGLISAEQLSHDWKGVRWLDASKRLPYRDNSVDKIYSSHFLEHLPLEKGRRALREFHRVLKTGGVLRLVVPDLVWHARRYVNATEKVLSRDSLPRDRSAHDAFLTTVCGAYLQKGRFGAEHCYMYDLPTLVDELHDAGFAILQEVAFREGRDDELASFDSRPEESLHVEAFKGS